MAGFFLGMDAGWTCKLPPPITDVQALRTADALVAIKDAELRRALVRLIQRLAAAAGPD